MGVKRMTKDNFTDEDKIKSSLNLWAYKENKTIIGEFVKYENGNFGKQAVLLVDEKEVSIPSLSVLNSKLGKLEKGNRVKIVYTGEEKAEESGRYYSTFDVFVKFN